MREVQKTWLSDGVELLLPSVWAPRAWLLLGAGMSLLPLAILGLMMAVLLVDSGAMFVDQSGCDRLQDLERAECAAFEQKPSLRLPSQNAWVARRVCALGQGEAGNALLMETDAFLPWMLEQSLLSCDAGWRPAELSGSALPNDILVDEIARSQLTFCDKTCETYATELAWREWARLREIQEDRLAAVREDWRSYGHPVLRWLALLFGVASLLILVVFAAFPWMWKRAVRPVRVRFGAHALEVDATLVPLESLRSAELDSNRLRVVWDEGELLTRALSREAIEELDVLLAGTRRREGEDDGRSLARVKALMGSRE